MGVPSDSFVMESSADVIISCYDYPSLLHVHQPKSSIRSYKHHNRMALIVLIWFSLLINYSLTPLGDLFFVNGNNNLLISDSRCCRSVFVSSALLTALSTQT